MKKGVLSVILGLVFIFLLMPSKVFAATEYNVWVNGEQFTSDKLTIECGSGTATYDPTQKEITLNNATITKVHGLHGIEANNITIVLTGDNTITAANRAIGIYANGGNIEITGSGNLTIQSGEDGCYVENFGDVTISGSGDVTVNGGGECGFYLDEGNLILSGSGNVTAKGLYYAVMLWETGKSVLLNGTAPQISLESTDSTIAVWNEADNTSPVGGDNFSGYSVTGAPGEKSVVYSLGKRTVKFDMGGHGTSIADQEIYYGSSAVRPANPTAEGFVFDDWYSDAKFTDKYDFSTPVTNNVTVYAKWTENSTEPTDPDIPDTGDSVQGGMWGILCSVSGLTLAALILLRRRKVQ